MLSGLKLRRDGQVTVTSGESGGAALVTHDWWCDVGPTVATDAGWLGRVESHLWGHGPSEILRK